jgi:nicotinate-nucleotide adenylyltransferase
MQRGWGLSRPRLAHRSASIGLFPWQTGNLEITGMRVGVFGGTFDPIHLGHLILAEYCRTDCQLDRVMFVPAATAPHKQDQRAADTRHRIEMLNLATAGHENFEISTIEIDRGGVSYTVDTLRSLMAEDSRRELFLMLGADSLADLPNWKQPGEICSLATLVVVGRPDTPEPDFEPLKQLLPSSQLAAFLPLSIVMPLIGLSSSEIRRRVAAGQSIRYQTPRAVEKYIETEKLYVGDPS